MNGNTVSTRSDLSQIDRAVAFIELFRGLQRGIATETIRVFLAVARQPGLLRREYELLCDLSSSSINRHLHILGGGDVKRTPGATGMGLVFTDADPLDPRQHRAYLTKAGARLRDDILHIINEGR